MQFTYNTPERQPFNSMNIDSQRNSARIHHFSQQSNRNENGGIDYKAKTFQLMQAVSQMQIKDKQLHRTVFYLQRQLQIIHKDLDQFLISFNASSLADVKLKYSIMEQNYTSMKQFNGRPFLKEQKISEEYERILNEYKHIITTQEEKMKKYQSKWRSKENTLTQQLQQSKGQVQQLSDQLIQSKQRFQAQLTEKQTSHKCTLQKMTLQFSAQKSQLTLQLSQQSSKAIQVVQQQNSQLKSDLQMIKTQFRQLIIEKQSIQDRHERLKKKYKQEIEHFQLIEKEVEEKLIEVEKEITFYKEERDINLESIARLKEEIARAKQDNTYLKDRLSQRQDNQQEEFSFGGYFSVETQTDSSHWMVNGEEMTLNAQCYEISIKSLLEENTRLKRTLVLMDKAKKGENLPPQAELQLKLLKSLSEVLSYKPRKQSTASKDFNSPDFNGYKNKSEQVLDQLKKQSQEQ